MAAKNYCDGYSDLSKEFIVVSNRLSKVETEVSNIKEDVTYLVKRERQKEIEFKKKLDREKIEAKKEKRWFIGLTATILISIGSGVIFLAGHLVDIIEYLRSYFR